MDENNQKEGTWSGREGNANNQAPDLEIPQIEWSRSETKTAGSSFSKTGQSSRYSTDSKSRNAQTRRSAEEIKTEGSQIKRETGSERSRTGRFSADSGTEGNQVRRSGTGAAGSQVKKTAQRSGNGMSQTRRPAEKVQEGAAEKRASQGTKRQNSGIKTASPEKRDVSRSKPKTSAASTGRKKLSQSSSGQDNGFGRTIIPVVIAIVIIAALLVAIIIHAVQTGNEEKKESKEPKNSTEAVTLDEKESNRTDENETDDSMSKEAGSNENESNGIDSNKGENGGEGQETGEEQQPQSTSGDESNESGAEPSAAGTGETVYATTVLNVRSIPDTSGEALGQLQAGEAVIRTADENGWSTIEYNGVTAYVSSQYITTEQPQQGNETPTGTGTNSLSMYPIHEGQWDLNTLDNDPVAFGNDPKQRAENMVPTDWAYYEKLWGQFNVDWIQDFNSNTVYLTMDEGFGNDETIMILDTLKEKNVKIVFFLTQNFVNDRPELVQRMIDEGHILGNHTCTHPNMVTLSIEDATAQIMTLHNQVKEQFGYEMSLFRFPEGAYSNQRLALVENLGYKSVFWSFAYDDFSSQPLGLEEAREEIWKYIHPGAIFLLHAHSSVNAALLGDFIDEVRSRGFEFGMYPLTAN